MSDEMKGGGWDGAGDSTDAVNNEHVEFWQFLGEHGKNGIVLNGLVAWINIVHDRGANDLWKVQANMKYSDDEVSDAKANLWKAASKALSPAPARQGENKKKSEIEDIHQALQKLKELSALPLILASSKMIADLPVFGGLNEESNISDVINKVVVLENSMNSFVKQQNEHMVTLRRIICASNSNNAGLPPNIQIPRSVLPSVTEVFDSPNTNKRKRIDGEVTD